jgi:DtxR family transcriptional regulator, Mn-dependent transcriptional regulator
MDKRQKIEEGLSIIWEEREKGVLGAENIRKAIENKLKEDISGVLAEEGYIKYDKSQIVLTPKGETAAEDITRRCRLAERLLIDVLELGRGEMDSTACEFEHVISKEVEESICTLLGHPRECPHGLPIPPGRCCEKAKEMLGSIVVPITRLSPGEAAKVVYVLTRKHPQLHKLMSLGITPGVNISIHQISPSVVIQVEETQVALEKEIASEIYVKRMSENRSARTEGGMMRWRLGGRRLRKYQRGNAVE